MFARSVGGLGRMSGGDIGLVDCIPFHDGCEGKELGFSFFLFSFSFLSFLLFFKFLFLEFKLSS